MSARSRRSVAVSTGLPLAIELAAARLRVLSLEQIATRLDDRFRLLRAGERTLEAVVAWSYDLLTDAEREVFVRLAVFPADFSLEAAEMVVSDAAVEAGDVLDVLARLVEKSLVTTVITDNTYRYRLLETLREYALARLDERGEIDRWNDRLLEWAMTRVEYVEESLRRPAQDAALQSVIADAATLRAAMNWADPRATTWPHRGSPWRYPSASTSERRQIITSLLERLGPGVEPWFAGHAYSALGELAYDQGDWLVAWRRTRTARTTSSRPAPTTTQLGPTSTVRTSCGAGRLGGGRSGDLTMPSPCSEAATTRWASATRCRSRHFGHPTSTRRSDWPPKPTSSCERPTRPIGIAHNVEAQGIIAYDRDELADAAAFVAEAVEVFAGFGNLGCSAHALEAAAVIVGRNGRARGGNRAPRRRRRTPSQQRRRPQAMGDPRPPRRHRRPHRRPSLPRARGGAQRGNAAHRRVRRPRRASTRSRPRHGSDIRRSRPRLSTPR